MTQYIKQLVGNDIPIKNSLSDFYILSDDGEDGEDACVKMFKAYNCKNCKHPICVTIRMKNKDIALQKLVDLKGVPLTWNAIWKRLWRAHFIAQERRGNNPKYRSYCVPYPLYRQICDGGKVQKYNNVVKGPYVRNINPTFYPRRGKRRRYTNTKYNEDYTCSSDDDDSELYFDDSVDEKEHIKKMRTKKFKKKERIVSPCTKQVKIVFTQQQSEVNTIEDVEDQNISTEIDIKNEIKYEEKLARLKMDMRDLFGDDCLSIDMHIKMKRDCGDGDSDIVYSHVSIIENDTESNTPEQTNRENLFSRETTTLVPVNLFPSYDENNDYQVVPFDMPTEFAYIPSNNMQDIYPNYDAMIWSCN